MYYLKCIIYIVYLLLYLVLLFYSPQMSRACRHQWRNRCSAHPHTCPSHCDQTVEIVIFFFTILIKVVINIKLHASPHTCPKGSCDLKDECNHLHWFENVLLSLFWSSSASTSASTITTTLHWFEDVRVCLRLSFPIRGLPGSAGACSELESCSCYHLFAVFVTVFVSVFVTAFVAVFVTVFVSVFVTVFVSVFVTVFVLSLSLISRSVGCQSACSELKSSFSSLFLLLWSLFI